jgi:hypothetical protein
MTAVPLEPSEDSSGSASSVVTSLRVRPGTIRLWQDRQPYITIRVEMPEVWDTVRIEAPPTAAVLTVKTQALGALYPEGADVGEFVIKLNGFEVRDEAASLADAGAADGSTFLLTFRRRRPVKS